MPPFISANPCGAPSWFDLDSTPPLALGPLSPTQVPGTAPATGKGTLYQFQTDDISAAVQRSWVWAEARFVAKVTITPVIIDDAGAFSVTPFDFDFAISADRGIPPTGGPGPNFTDNDLAIVRESAIENVLIGTITYGGDTWDLYLPVTVEFHWAQYWAAIGLYYYAYGTRFSLTPGPLFTVPPDGPTGIDSEQLAPFERITTVFDLAAPYQDEVAGIAFDLDDTPVGDFTVRIFGEEIASTIRLRPGTTEKATNTLNFEVLQYFTGRA